MVAIIPVALRASNDCRSGLRFMEGDPKHPGQPMLVSYYCSSGKLTNGYGHTKNVKKLGERCTYGQAEQWLTEDIQEAEAIVWRNVHVPLTQAQFDALIFWVFNFGETKFKAWQLVRMVNDPASWARIPDQWTTYVHEIRDGSAYKTRGLLVRRFRELCRWYGFSWKVCALAANSENVVQKTVWRSVNGPDFSRKQFYEYPGTTTWQEVLERARSAAAFYNEADDDGEGDLVIDEPETAPPEPEPEPPPPAPEPLVLDTPIQPPPEPVTVQEAPPAALPKETPMSAETASATKHPLQSSTIWGIVILAMVPQLEGLAVAFGQIGEQVSGPLSGIFQVVGLWLGIAGRFGASVALAIPGKK